jgi:glycosyltransferase involved in cell wall biosynthesis
VKITMLLSNGFAPDPRVAAEAVALQEAGHQVTIFAWDRIGEYPERDSYQGVRLVRSRIRTTYSRGPLQIIQFFKFWRECRFFLRTEPADAIHCHDLDTLWPGVAMGRKLGVPVIFDAHESYPDMVAHLFPEPVLGMVRRLEASLVPKTTAVITVGRILAQRFEKLRAPRVVVVGNYKTIQGTPAALEPPLPLRLIYVGGLNRDRLLEPLITAVNGDPRFQLRVVGDGPEWNRLQGIAGDSGNIVFTGFLPHDTARRLIDESHLVYYGVDARFPNNRYSAPNSLFLALAAGRPVITTAVGEIAAIVQTENCGSVLPDLSIETIRRTLERYLDDRYWRTETANAFQASQTVYNWEMARSNLIGLYRGLERNHGKTPIDPD